MKAVRSKDGTYKVGPRPRVVVVGAGFGGINVVLELRDAPVDVLLVDRRNYHLFQPLLYQVATAGLSPGDIAYPVRAMFRRQKNADFMLANVDRVDLEGRQLLTSNGPLEYDYLVISAGSQTNFFGLDAVEQYGFELKDLDDAESIRNHILRMFELARYTSEPEERLELRTFVIVGGGPTGVECAGSISELNRLVLTKDYPDLKLDDVRVVVLEMMEQLLPGFPAELGRAAVKRLHKKGVEVRLGEALAEYDGRQVTLKSGEVIPSRTVIWAAGVKAASLVDGLGVEQARQGRVVVEPTLQIPRHPEVYVIGDAAYLEEDGKPLPMVAPVAIQQAKAAVRNIRRQLAGQDLQNFDYRDPGSLATIGRHAAVAHVWGLKFSGFLAWLIWLVVHLFWLIGFRNRLLVLINWAWEYFLYDRAVRLITPDARQSAPLTRDEVAQQADLPQVKPR